MDHTCSNNGMKMTKKKVHWNQNYGQFIEVLGFECEMKKLFGEVEHSDKWKVREKSIRNIIKVYKFTIRCIKIPCIFINIDFLKYYYIRCKIDAYLNKRIYTQKSLRMIFLWILFESKRFSEKKKFEQKNVTIEKVQAITEFILARADSNEAHQSHY